MSENSTLDKFHQNPTQVTAPTELSDIPDSWSAARLGDVSIDNEGAFVDGPFGSNLKADEMNNEGYARIIQLQNIRVSEFINSNHKYISKEKYNELKRHGAKPGDLAIAKMAKPVARACILPDIEERYLVVADCIKLSVNKNKHNSVFVMFALNSTPVWKQAFARSRGSTRKRINLTQLKEVQIPSPSLQEQRKIAAVLNTINQAIEKTENIIEHLNKIKTGVVQNLFKKGVEDHESYIETKSGEMPESWDLVQFNDVIENTRYGTDTKSNTDGDGYPTLRIPNVVNKRITLEDLKYTPLNDDELNRLELKENDILVLRTNGNPDYVGRCVTFSEQDEPFVFASYLIRIRVNEACVRPAYIREFFNSRRGRTEMAGWIRSSAGNYNLSVGSIKKFQIPIPSLEEQDMIVKKIRAIEHTIKSNQKNRDQLQHLKKGLMQDVLSGTVRTTNTNIQVPDEVEQHG